MLKIRDIINIIEDFAPLALQMEGDNCGLIYGDPTVEVTGVLVTLDLTPQVAQEAINHGCNLIIEHHPSIFLPVKKIDLRYPNMGALVTAIKNDIAVYAAHTNVDFAPNGLNDYLMQILGATDIRTVGEDVEGARIGLLPAQTTLKELADMASVVLSNNNIRFSGHPERTIRTIAAINGGGGGSAQTVLDCIDAGADIFLTSDIKYNVIRLAKDLDYAIIDIGHYDSELAFIALIAELLESKCEAKVVRAKSCTNPYYQ
ncbi:MAG: Nif3-like dinuclear metal center hexameric protein [Clostridia bacterium]